MKHCKLNNGYCIRQEKNYCHTDECKGCDHADTHLAVLEIVANCEKTAIQCDYCGELLTEPKVDCR